jgi:DNA-directed RNA polymerase specialized sigma24 family protein
LLRFARRQLGSRAELAEDVLQEAFLNAYRHLAAGATTPQNTRAWLFAIVHNAAINAVRAPQTRGFATARARRSLRVRLPTPDRVDGPQGARQQAVRE